MPRIARLVVTGEPAVYHVICRSALDGLALGDVEKEQFVKLLRELSSVYFVELFGFCVMGNHAHVVARVDTGEAFSDDEIRRRFRLYYPTAARKAGSSSMETSRSTARSGRASRSL